MEVLQARPQIIKFIKKISQDNGISNCIITDIKTNKKGEGYLGEIFMVTVSNGQKQLEMVVKAAFINPKVREIAPVKLSFQNEIYFYQEVYPKFLELEEGHGIKKPEYVPKCLKVCVEEQKEMLALENLKISGFEVFDKTSMLDHNHFRLIFETYGRFHASSFVLRDQKPEEYSKIVGGLYNVYGECTNKSRFGEHLTEVNKFVVQSLVPGEDDEVIEKYKKYSGKKIADIYHQVSTRVDEYCGILHGDCWSNNMMFKYEISNNVKKPIDMRLIDWQIIKVGSPVCDLSYCLYSGASKDIFDHLNEYLKIYHNSFSYFVKKMGSDPDKLYPFSVLRQHWKKYAKFGMVMAFAILRLKLTQKEDLLDLTDDFELDEFQEAFARMRFSEDDYKKRIRELLVHMYEEDAL